MITIFHNPRCRKSREGLEILEKSGQEFIIRKYLEDPPGKAEIRELLKLLNMEPGDLIRRGEAVWKNQYAGKDMSAADLIDAMASHPKLIERPIVIQGSKAVVGRPPEKIRELLNN